MFSERNFQNSKMFPERNFQNSKMFPERNFQNSKMFPERNFIYRFRRRDRQKKRLRSFPNIGKAAESIAICKLQKRYFTTHPRAGT